MTAWDDVDQGELANACLRIGLARIEQVARWFGLDPTKDEIGRAYDAALDEFLAPKETAWQRLADALGKIFALTSANPQKGSE